MLNVSSQKDGIIERFLMNRCNFVISGDEQKPVFWRFLCYEIMYLWNLLGSCSSETLQKIIEDCENEDKQVDPIIGLRKFLTGAAYTLLKDEEKAISSYSECIELCNDNSADLHLFYIPAYASYELAVILMKSENEDSKNEAQKLIQNAQSYRNFDFEHRLKLKLVNFKTY